jgi:putative FmdB family regulatory protein
LGIFPKLATGRKLCLLYRQRPFRVEPMPTYQYRCDKCGNKFERTETISEHEALKLKCPKCGSKKVSFVRYGVDPRQVPDFIALRGDPSDKLSGAPGVAASGAATLLQRYGTLEAALTAGRFPAQAESLRLYRSIATMNRKAPLPNLRNQKPTWRKAADLARDWELNQLAKRLEELASV